jgi:outer membrane immunogenic protein
MGALKGVGFMKKLLLTSVALTALVTAPALAADMRVRGPVKAPPPPPPPFFSWTGCYIGGHIGGLWASKEWRLDDNFEGLGVLQEHHGEHDVDGFLGGIQGGCDYQFGGPGGGFVIGIAADWAWSSADGNHDRFFSFIDDGARFHTDIESIASVTARFGWALDRFLVYVKGGFAWERDEYRVTALILGDVWTASETRTGFTVGAGGEYAFTPFLSAFLEANWYVFDDERLRFNHSVVNIDPLAPQWEIEESKLVLKGGINFRFGGWGAPLAARY